MGLPTKTAVTIYSSGFFTAYGLVRYGTSQRFKTFGHKYWHPTGV